ncbi:YlxR family protein [Actinokineospora sp. HUAS TT18]|uniref:YlxR family protein n=1 Tax=Actinokineospora sp. HUAS TT18 TaxID=3447451 RepID=UPI003F52460B
MVHRQEPVSARPGGASPVRTCVGCRARAADKLLLRVVLVDGNVVPDPRRRMPGRGAWIHPDPSCLATAEKRRAFSRAFKVQGTVGVEVVRSEIERHADSVGVGRPHAEEETRKQVDPS